MVLVDTSVWIEHFRSGVPALADALLRDMVLLHPVVIGELSTGNLKHRTATLADLRRQPLATMSLVSAKLSSVPLWSTDRRLAETAKHLSLDFTAPS